MSLHLFSVGEVVRMKNRHGRPLTTPDVYRITALLPPADRFNQYRIRNDGEAHERVTTEDNLERVAPGGFGAEKSLS